MLTEKDAATRWCPFVRFTSSHDDSAANRWKQSEPTPCALNPVPCRCIASECMAWRWQPLMADEAFQAAVVNAAAEIGDTSPQKAKAAKHVGDNRAKYGLPTEPFQGFCGLAGKPVA